MCWTLLGLNSQKILSQEKVILTDARILVKVSQVVLSYFEEGR